MSQYYPTLNQASSRQYRWGVYLIILTLIMIADFVGATRPVRALGERALSPLQYLSNTVISTMTQPFQSLHSLQTAQRRIQDLELRYAETSAQLGELDRLKAENQALREMLGASDIKLAQRSITRPIVSYGRSLVAGGKEDGIREGQMVLIKQTLVGLVGSVSEAQAEVRLLSQEGTQPVLAHTESGVQGLVVGDGKRVILTEIPLDAEVKVGERVMTDGQEGIARDVLLGRVASVKAEPADSTQTIVIEQLVSFYEAQVIEIR
jgi:rod shape-determining protein MreC